MDKIGITWAYGKTTTTTMITPIFKKAEYVEITGELHKDFALGLLNAIENDDVIKLAVCTVDEALNW